MTNTQTQTATQTVTATHTATTTTTSTGTRTATLTQTATQTRTLTNTQTQSATQTATQTYTSTATQTGTATRTATVTQTATQTKTATKTPTGTSTSTITVTTTPTVTSTVTTTSTTTPTSTRTATTTVTNTPTVTSASTITVTNTPTVTSTVTNTSTATPTLTTTATQTVTNTPTLTSTATTTVTNTPTVTSTVTNTSTATPTLTTTATQTVTNTPTVTSTATTTVTNTPTVTSTVTNTGTITPTNTTTVTQTVTNTPTVTNTTTITATSTPTVTNTVTSTSTTTPTITTTSTATRSSTSTVTGTATGTQAATGTTTTTTTNTVTATNTTTGTITTTVTTTSSSNVDGGVGLDGDGDVGSAACLQNWQNSGACGQWCLEQSQTDLADCVAYLACYLANNCGPTTCGGQDQVCGVNVVRPAEGTAPKNIADQVYQCLACAGSSPVSSCANPLAPDTTPCSGGDGGVEAGTCQSGVCMVVAGTGSTTSTGTATNTTTSTATSTATATVTSTGVVDAGTTSDATAGGCLLNWRSTTCGEWCVNQPQADWANCVAFLDCYENHNCSPATCGANPDDVCGVNKVAPAMGVAPKTIADKVYQCLACPGSSPVTSCADIPDTAPCTDGNACTKGDRCFGGVCTPGTSVTCMASDQCHNQGLCDPASGLCSNPPKDDGSPCEDGDACTTGDTCKSGLCTSGTPVVCNGGNSGTIAYCDSTQGCQRAVIFAGDLSTPGDSTPGDLVPVVNCVVHTAPGYYTAIFGYQNNTPGNLAMPLGDQNTLSLSGGGDINDTLPIWFLTGKHDGAMVIYAQDPQSLTWTLDGSSATATTDSSSCTIDYSGNIPTVRDSTTNQPLFNLPVQPDQPPEQYRYMNLSGQILPTDQVSNQTFGKTDGTFAVTDDGAATYRIPLWLPAGRNGVEPKLALVYNSNVGDGILGMGWKVEGLSMITRCAQDYARDGRRRAIQFDNLDRLCLDGQRLVLYSGTYNQTGSEYRTEYDRNLKIVQVGEDSLDGVANSPTGFLVYLPDGTRQSYGLPSAGAPAGYLGAPTAVMQANRATVTIDDSNETVPDPTVAYDTPVRLGWALASSRDRYDNVISYAYNPTDDYVGESGETVVDFRPESIEYTSNMSASGETLADRFVTFLYDQGLTRSDVRESYVSGLPLRTGHALTGNQDRRPQPNSPRYFADVQPWICDE